VDPKGRTVWEFKPEDVPSYRLSGFPPAGRLPNGNTLVNNWVNMWNPTIDKSDAEVEALEVTPDKHVVWALSEWNNPDLGPATTMQLLDGSVLRMFISAKCIRLCQSSATRVVGWVPRPAIDARVDSPPTWSVHPSSSARRA
jgi:hypothetical protein